MSTVRTILGRTTVQAIIALTLTGVFSYLSVAGQIPAEMFIGQFATVIGFFFAKALSS